MKTDNSPIPKNRLDVEIARRGLVRSRSAARELIERKLVMVKGIIVTKPSHEVAETDEISLTETPKFVSRAGEKLEHALATWDIDVSGLLAIDVGSSTGGFTDCLLQRGAKKVIAVEVGTGQFDATLRTSEKVELHEQTDIRKFSLAEGEPLADIIVSDVSFISLSHVLPKMFSLLKKGGEAVLLVKPQFEVGRELAHRRRGVISIDSERLAALEAVKASAKKVAFKVIRNIDSPIEGEGGNREFLLRLAK
ncbi:MAG: TlyA family RNA methyltransferase [Candidatus Paceibacterota bacterium]|jgi:23S rRNA (cytidine1920-2'-O)/16S rRNA (cytidine1409-2'-O)-methyltransferase